MATDFDRWNVWMSELKSKLGSIQESIPEGASIYYIDYPVHTNIGDLLIMFGTEKFFSEHHVTVLKRYSFYNCPQHINAPTNVILVFHGGGNFGDLYPRHQMLRERIIRNHPYHKIVILPQTVHYSDTSNIRNLVNACETHNDLHIYLRDSVSQSFIRRHLQNAKAFLVPDMAHVLWPVYYHKPSRASGSELLLIRRDIEQLNLNSSLIDQYIDWGDLLNRVDHQFVRAVHGFLTYAPPGTDQNLAKLWRWYSRKLVSRALTVFQKYDTVITSRLHGHILACLMGKPTVLLDNSYGKNSRYYNSWTQEIPFVRMDDREH